MHKSIILLFSFLIGSLVVIGLIWMMSKLIYLEPSSLEVEKTDTTFVFQSKRERLQQCDRDVAEVGDLVKNSQTCQSDEECASVRVSRQFAAYLGCSVVIRQDSKEQVIKAFGQDNNCRTGMICDGPKVSSYTAVCRNNSCTSERQERPPSLDILTERTLESISESLLEESNEVND